MSSEQEPIVSSTIYRKAAEMSLSSSQPRTVGLLKRNSSFKHFCQFSLSFCLKGSQDLRTWFNEFAPIHLSSFDPTRKYYKQVQSHLSLVFVILALIILSLEIIWCLSLFGEIIFEPGIVFMFILIVAVGWINAQILLNISRSKITFQKDKSKEI